MTAPTSAFSHLNHQNSVESQISTRFQHQFEFLIQRLFHTEKMTAIGSMAASLAHELNNPVGCVACNLELLKENIDKIITVLDAYSQLHSRFAQQFPKETYHIESLIQTSSLNDLQQESKDILLESQEGMERIKKLLSQLKSFSPIEELQSDDLNFTSHSIHVQEEIERVLNIVKGELKHHFRITTHYSPLPLVNYPSNRIAQITMFLLLYVHYHRLTRIENMDIRTGMQDQHFFIHISITPNEAASFIRSIKQEVTSSPKFTSSQNLFSLSVLQELLACYQGYVELKNNLSDADFSIQVTLPI